MTPIGHSVWERVKFHGKVVACASAVEVGLRTLPLPKLGKLLGVRILAEPEPGSAGQATNDRFPHAEWPRVQAATERLFRHWPFGGGCLRASLVQACMLRHHQPNLRIGVRWNEDFDAHAWLAFGQDGVDGARTARDGGPEYRVFAREG